MKSIDIRDIHFLKYRLYGPNYLRFYKDLKKLDLEFITEHSEEFFYLSRYIEYGLEYLKFLQDAIKLNLDEIVDMKDFRESKNGCILKWVFMDADEDRRRIDN